MFPFEQLDSKDFYPWQNCICSSSSCATRVCTLMVQTWAGLEIKHWRWVQPSRSSRTALDIWDVLELNCTLAKLLSIHPSGPIAGYHTGWEWFMRKKRRLLKNSVVVFFFCFPRKPRRQSDKMYEETIYADRQHGLFKRQVKEQLFWTSILMLTKK